MNAKWSITKRTAAIVAGMWLWMVSPIAAQEKDTVYIVKHDTIYQECHENHIAVSHVRPSRYDRRIHRYRKRWEALIPTHSKLQFAGGMGLLSIGPGWDYGKRNQWETDILIGFLPKFDSGSAKVTLTLKQNYIPWSLQIKQSRFSVEPLTCGMYLNTVFGEEFWVREPERYPKGYYNFSSKVRIHIFLGQRFTFEIDPQRTLLAKEISFFYEISTCDLYLVSAFTNKYLKPKDYLSLSFGIKVQLL